MLPAEAEAVVVGAGAAGSYFARRLAEAGREVLVIEAGPGWTEADLVSNQVWARRLRFGGEPVAVAGRHPFAFNFNAGWGLGGAALHHYGTWPRMHPADFEMAGRTGRGLDWPLSYDDLAPYYDRIQRLVGLSGDATAEIWRPPGEPYPLPPLTVLAQGRAIARGFAALDIPVAPAPMAILSRPYDGRPACLYDGWCDAGCPIGALYNPLVRDIPGARAAGARFVTGTTVTRIEADRRRAGAVTCVDGDGESRTVRTDLLVLAGSVVGNPALMLNSTGPAHPDGLGNGSGLVGRYFMSHILAGVYGLFPEPTDPHLGVSGAQLICHEGYPKMRQDGPFGSYQWLIAPTMKPNDLLGAATTRADLFGTELETFMLKATRHIGSMLAFAEELPRRENRIELTRERDRFGNRRARVVHGYTDEAIALRALAETEGLNIFEAAGARERWASGINQAHMMGGTIMGEDASRSVCDGFGRVHELTNVFVAGSGLFPTSGAVNPTFTIYALAARTMDHLLSHWSDYV